MAMPQRRTRKGKFREDTGKPRRHLNGKGSEKWAFQSWKKAAFAGCIGSAEACNELQTEAKFRWERNTETSPRLSLSNPKPRRYLQEDSMLSIAAVSAAEKLGSL